MDCFETIAATLLEFDGYWVRRSFKVNVNKVHKRTLGKNSMPRPEIDLLAFKSKKKEDLIIAFEAKSYLNSPGVSRKEIKASHKTTKGRYKIFTCKNYRDIVIKQLKKRPDRQGNGKKINENQSWPNCSQSEGRRG
jgi:hypothetical protein